MRRRSVPLALTLALLAGMTAASGFNDIATPDPSDLGDTFDSRATAPGLGATKLQGRALIALARQYPDVKLEWNAPFGTPSSILRFGKALSPARAGSPAAVAKAWLRSHAGVFDWSAANVAALSVEKTLTQPRGGATTVLLHQIFGGLHGGSLGGSLVVALDRENRILSVRANVARTAELARGWSVSALRALRITAHAQAFRPLGRRGEWYRFSPGAFAAEHFVRRVAFPTGRGPARPAWEVFFVKKLFEGYRTVVDAQTGEVLYRYQLAQFEAPEGNVFDYYPGAPKGGTQELRSFAGDPKASPQGWLTVPPGLPSVTTLGNNASTATNWFVFLAPDGPGQIRPISPTGVFDYAFADSWNSTNCGENPVSASQGTPDTPVYALDALPAVTNLFYHHNVMHDFFYNFGFDEEAGAMQVSNFGKTGGDLENDPLLGLVQAGAALGDAPLYLGRDNAYMFPFPDGLPQWSGMFLWEPVPQAIFSPCVDGDFSADVIYHEYTHGVTSRWVGGEFGNLGSFQGSSMGEAWSDFYALHYLHEKGLETKDILGLYVTPDPLSGIRNWALGAVPVGLGDIGYDVTGEEVHSDGEIWAGTIWDLRTAFKAAKAGGAELAAQLIADAMPIAGPLPSMVDMRNAILAADLARTKGANQALIWSVFAQHGMGVSASSRTAFDVNPVPGFDVPDQSHNATVAGKIVDLATKKTIAGARILISPFEARISPVKRAATDGSFTFKLQEGTYPVTIQAPGYGMRTLTLTVHGGETISREIGIAANYASQAAGAKIVSVSNASTQGPATYAIDDTATTAWWTDEDEDGPAGENFVVDLAGTDPVTISDVRISAYNAKGGSRFTALKNWKLSTSLDGKTFTQVASDAFKASIVRPKAPNLNFRNRHLATPARARFLKIEADPQDAAVGAVTLAELQVFGSGDEVKITPPAVDTSVFHDEGMVLVPSPALNLTSELMGAVCVFPPPTQGIDAWVSELPDAFGDGSHTIDVNFTPLLPDPIPDIDLIFLGPDCSGRGGIASSAPHEVGSIPQGAKYLVVSLFTALPGTVTIDAQSAVGAIPAPGPRVKGTKKTTLPATGVGSGIPLGLTLLGTAVVVALTLRRPRRRRVARS